MNEEVRLKALAQFLKKHRDKLQPAAVGLIAGGRRRTPGLRREEVAALAGVSTTWYTWLEQGRDIRCSAQVLDRIAEVLQMSEDERKYLYMLAQEHPVSADASPVGPALTPALVRILNELQHCPTIVSDRRCHIVGWNGAAAKVFLDFEQVPYEERNMIALLFLRKELKALAVNWSDFVRGFVGIFRSYYGQFVGDPWYDDFIASLGSRNPEFLEYWGQNDVSTAPEVVLEFRHAKVGKMLFDLTSLQVQGSSELRCSVYTPSSGSDTEHKMSQLLRSQTAGPRQIH